MGLQPGQCIVALDREYAGPDEPVRAGQEVALIPPVSGGAEIRCASWRSPTSRSIWPRSPPRCAIRAAGAVVCFEGVTREVEALDYEAYVEMARAKLEAIGAEEAARHGLCAVALVHAPAACPLSEPSVLVAASARRTAARPSTAPAR